MVESDVSKDVERAEGQPIAGAFSVKNSAKQGLSSTGKGLRSSKNGKRGYGQQSTGQRSEANACTSRTAAKIRQERREKRCAMGTALYETEDTTTASQTEEGQVGTSVLSEFGQPTNPNPTEVDEVTANPNPPELEGVVNQNPVQESLPDANVLAVATWVHEEDNQQNEQTTQNIKLLKKMGALLGFCLVVVVVLIIILMSQLMDKDSSSGGPTPTAPPVPAPTGDQLSTQDYESLDAYLNARLEFRDTVTALKFEKENSPGTIPTQIGLFSLVTEVEFDDNGLIGKIPTQIGLLTSLTKLELNGNSLTGTLPPQLGVLTLLEVLHLEDNSFTGIVPTHLGNLTRLKKTKLYSNKLEGSIPLQLCGIATLTSLRVDMATCITKPISPLECNCDSCKACGD